MSDIVTALRGFDPANADQWTDAGLPAIEAVKLALGRGVTREEIQAVAPRFSKDNLELPEAAPQAPAVSGDAVDDLDAVEAEIADLQAEIAALTKRANQASRRQAEILDQRRKADTPQARQKTQMDAIQFLVDEGLRKAQKAKAMSEALQSAEVKAALAKAMGE